MHHWLIGTVTCFSQSCNVMLLPFDMISPSIIDVVHLTGISSTNIEITASLKPEHVLLDLPDNFNYLDHNAFFCKLDFVPPSYEEHVAFLLHWLYHFVLCIPSLKITREYFNIVVLLPNQKVLTLAPFVLGALYRGLFTMVEKGIDTNYGGPF